MNIISPTINQMAFLFTLIAIGFILVKLNVLSKEASTVIAKLENTLFIPALVLGTFINHFTVQRLSSSWKLLLVSAFVIAIAVPLSILCARICSKDQYIRNIYTYGLSFSNFAFMGNAIVMELFPDVFLEYLIFTLVLWMMIYLWGVPSLLIPDNNKDNSIKEKLKSFVNPMFVSMIIGIVIGITGLSLPPWVTSVIDTAGSCMSPLAMILTGITVASIDFKKTFTDISIYAVSIIRLLIFPLIAIGVFALVPASETVIICTVASLAMPLGLNTIVIPSAYGKDSSVATGMALISHLLSCVTIPIIFYFMSMVI